MVEPLVDRLVRRTAGRGIVSVAVVGSAARGEETRRDGQMVGDIDLAVVVNSPDPRVPGRLQQAAAPIEAGIRLGVFPVYSLRRFRTIEFYEAKFSSWVAWGRADVFDVVPVDNAGEIPRWEAVRLVLNRAMHCLEARIGRAPAWYAAVKTYLALAEADLVFAGRYGPSYRDRWEAIRQHENVLGSPELVEKVQWATRAKLGGATLAEPADPAEHEGWMLDGLGIVLSRYLGQTVSVGEGLRAVGNQQRHLPHRAAYIARHLREPSHWLGALHEDPIFPIWRRGVSILAGASSATETEIQALLADWETTHQPLPR